MKITTAAAVLLGTLMVLSACNKEKKEAPAQEEGKGAAATEVTEGKAPAEPASPPAQEPAAKEAKAIDCDKLITDATKEELTLSKGEYKGAMAKVPGAICDFKKDEKTVNLNVMCPTWGEDTFKKTMEVGQKAAKGGKSYKDLEAGRMGYLSTRGPGIVIAQVWDDDTMCYATVTAFEDATAEKMIEAFVKNMTPALLE